MSFLTELFVFLVAALAVVPLLNRFGLSSVIGYLIAGAVIGPSGLAIIGNAEGILHFAEIGIVLLLFIIGLELQPRRLWVMRRAVFGLGSFQVVITSCVLGTALWLLGLPFTAALLIGFSLALSSTAFVLQLLGEQKQLNHAHGRAAFGVLLFQDIAVIPVIALLSIVGAGANEEAINPWLIAAVITGFIAARFMLRPILRLIAATGIHELFLAASLAIVTGSALAMYHAGLSMGLGAFIAGMMVADSEYRHQMETDVTPFKGLLLGLFFIAVGMSANLGLLSDAPLTILALTAALITLKTLTLLPLALWHGLDRKEALRTAVILSQGGEFAFVLLTVAVGGSFIDAKLMETAVVVVTLSMASTPFLLIALEKFTHEATDDRPFDDMEHQKPEIIIAGFGRFGQIVGRLLTTQQIPYIAMDANPGQVDFVRQFGNEVFYGDATRLDTLQNAGVNDAKVLVLAIEDIDATVHVVEMLRENYPDLVILARAHNRQHEIKLRDLGVQLVVRDTLMSSLSLTESLLVTLGKTPREASNVVDAFRQHDAATLAKQAAVVHDKAAYRQTTMDAAEELRQLFADDQDRSN